ncbi:MAG: glycosyltransferase family 9 protein [Candidatus Sericytochromatia bacterium]|nr:glycosyltransferase family 9 protein [Candidatus Sericytochromatia bacterium]
MTAPPVDVSVRRILIVNFGGIGDEILFFPVIRSLREAYPHAHLAALVEPRCEGIMRFNTAIDRTFTFEAKHRPSKRAFARLVWQLRREGYDMAVTAGSSPLMALLVWLTGARHRVGYAAHRWTSLLTHAVPLVKQQYAAHMYHDLVGWLGLAPQPPRMEVPEADLAWASAFLTDHGRDPARRLVVLHPGVSRLSIEKRIIKGWAPERWVALGRALTAAGHQVLLAGGPDDAEVIALIRNAGDFPRLDAYGATKSLGQLAALLQLADAVVAVDSAPMHVGVAVGTPTVAIFGPTDPAKLLPPNTPHVAVVREALACRPCLWDHRQTSCEALTCLEEIGVDHVAGAVARTLAALQASGAQP